MTDRRATGVITRRADLLILIAVLALFWVAAFYQIRLPGFYYDEAADVAPAMQIVQGDPAPLDMAQSLTIGPLRLPVMVMVYVGAVSTYAVLPFYWLFGVSVEATRAMTKAESQGFLRARFTWREVGAVPLNRWGDLRDAKLYQLLVREQ